MKWFFLRRHPDGTPCLSNQFDSAQRVKNKRTKLAFRSFIFKATPRIELGNKSFADFCLTAWLCRRTQQMDYTILPSICQDFSGIYRKFFSVFSLLQEQCISHPANLRRSNSDRPHRRGRLPTPCGRRRSPIHILTL